MFKIRRERTDEDAPEDGGRGEDHFAEGNVPKEFDNDDSDSGEERQELKMLLPSQLSVP